MRAAAPPAAFVPPPQPVISPLTDWSSHTFDISLLEMVNAFRAAGLDVANDPERLITKTSFLAVELYRQEPVATPGMSVRYASTSRPSRRRACS